MPTAITQRTTAQGLLYCQRQPVNPAAKRVILHHTWRPNSAQYRGLATVEGIQRYHMEGRGWDDIGYHLLIGPDGAVYNGRPFTQIGAHCKGQNRHLGVAAIANFDAEDPWSWGGLWALQLCVSALLERMGVGPEAVRFHRDFAAKSCPGVLLNGTRFRASLTAPEPALTVALEGGAPIDCHPEGRGGVTRVDLRALATALGYDVSQGPPTILLRRRA